VIDAVSNIFFVQNGLSLVTSGIP